MVLQEIFLVYYVQLIGCWWYCYNFSVHDECLFINRLQVDKAVQLERIKYYIYTSYNKLSICDLYMYNLTEVHTLRHYVQK